MPVVAVAIAAPLASASGAFPDAQSTAVLGNTSPNAGSNVNYTFSAQIADGDGGYEDGGSYKDGWYVQITTNGAGYASVGNLLGLTAVDGMPGKYFVVGEQQNVRFRINGFTYAASCDGHGDHLQRRRRLPRRHRRRLALARLIRAARFPASTVLLHAGGSVEIRPVIVASASLIRRNIAPLFARGMGSKPNLR